MSCFRMRQPLHYAAGIHDLLPEDNYSPLGIMVLSGISCILLVPLHFLHAQTILELDFGLEELIDSIYLLPYELKVNVLIVSIHQRHVDNLN